MGRSLRIYADDPEDTIYDAHLGRCDCMPRVIYELGVLGYLRLLLLKKLDPASEVMVTLRQMFPPGAACPDWHAMFHCSERSTNAIREAELSGLYYLGFTSATVHVPVPFGALVDLHRTMEALVPVLPAACVHDGKDGYKAFDPADDRWAGLLELCKLAVANPNTYGFIE